jgi:hypothetical protein
MNVVHDNMILLNLLKNFKIKNYKNYHKSILLVLFLYKSMSIFQDVFIFNDVL